MSAPGACALRGEVIVARAGKPRVRLAAIAKLRRPRRPGFWKGAVSMALDFDRTANQILDRFASKHA